ncbi:hypothetical protein ACOSP7_010434 [Xanthoceras sorbifolium]|uniref:50S ribosomal protein 6, chloroplastic n=1 Tax=Xanthoceras sorbifolium TaxID=99658 RepID=A0ABQ8HTG5_9ROSI|nr:hypothetical protein JRO89_XS07G0097300 [Xanthoceras sorbifolium]
MSISSFLGTQITVVSNFGSKTTPVRGNGNSNNDGLVVTIECSSRPTKKATAHHMKTRPRKTQPWDVNRKPTVYAPLPPLPPDWTLLSDDNISSSNNNSDTANGGGALAGPEAALPSPPDLQAPLASG